MKAGIPTLAFNKDGNLLATRDDAAPTTVWIWDLATLKPRAVLLQHSNVKRLSWHPSRADLLMIACIHDESIVYLWSASTDSPMVLVAPLRRAGGKLECNWLHTGCDKKPAIIVGDAGGFLVLWPDGREQVQEEEAASEADEQDHDQSLDSVVEMLAGRTPLPEHLDTTNFEHTVDDMDDFTASAFEDTFRGKRQVGVV